MTSSGNPEHLDAYARSMAEPDQRLINTGPAIVSALAAWTRAPSAYGGSVSGDLAGTLTSAASAIAYLDAWVAQVGNGFRQADAQHIDRDQFTATVAGPASLDAAVQFWKSTGLVTEVDNPHGPTRIIRLSLDSLPTGTPPAVWQLILMANGVTGATGPVDFLIHGWSAGTGSVDSAGRHAAQLYDERGIPGATVVVIDWPAGTGANAGNIFGDVVNNSPWGIFFDDDSTATGDFDKAWDNARTSGDIFANILTGLAAINPDAHVSIQAHSLGNHVAMRGITGFDDPTGRFNVDYTAIQPAVTDTIADDPEYNGILTNRVDHLTITINNSDKALLAYELSHGPEALGDEAIDGDGIRKILEGRDGPTVIVDHDSSAGSIASAGHLTIDPASNGLVRNLVDSAIEREQSPTGTSNVADIRETLFQRYGGSAVVIMEDPVITSYLDERRQLHEPVDQAALDRLIDERFNYHPPPDDGTPRPTPPAPAPPQFPIPGSETPEPLPTPPSPSPGPAPTPTPMPTPTG